MNRGMVYVAFTLTFSLRLQGDPGQCVHLHRRAEPGGDLMGEAPARAVTKGETAAARCVVPFGSFLSCHVVSGGVY